MKQSLINNEPLFDIWCKMIAKEVLLSKILTEDQVSGILKVAIIDNFDKFIEL